MISPFKCTVKIQFNIVKGPSFHPCLDNEHFLIFTTKVESHVQYYQSKWIESTVNLYPSQLVYGYKWKRLKQKNPKQWAQAGNLKNPF